MGNKFFKSLLATSLLLSFGAFAIDEENETLSHRPAAASVVSKPVISGEEFFAHGDVAQIIMSFTDSKDISSLLQVSKDFNALLEGTGEENNIAWQRWVQKRGVKPAPNQSFRDTLKEDFCLAKAQAALPQSDSAVHWIKKAIEYGSLSALHQKIKDYADGSHDYPKDPNRAFALNEALAETGDRDAISRRIRGYEAGSSGYPKDPQRAFALNEALAETGDRDAMARRIRGYENGSKCYPKDLQRAFALNEALAEAGDKEAIERRIMGYVNGWYGYPEDPSQAVALNEALAEAGD